jgi:hypothetical protein
LELRFTPYASRLTALGWIHYPRDHYRALFARRVAGHRSAPHFTGGDSWLSRPENGRECAVASTPGHVDIDRSIYWSMILDGNQEKVPGDPAWLTPLTLPDTIRISDILVSQGKKESGRVDVFFYPTGRIDTATMHLRNERNEILAIAIEPVTGAIRMSDERIEPPRFLVIPDRVRALLKTPAPGV